MDLLLQSLLVAAVLALCVGSVVALRDPLHPASLIAMLWGLVGLTYLAAPHALRQISLQTYLFVTTAVLAFVIGALSVPALKSGQLPVRQWETTLQRDLIFWIALLGLPLFILKADALAETADFTESAYINLRLALTGELDDAQTFGLLGYLVPVSFSSTLVELASSKRKLFEPRGWLSFLVSSAYAVLATGRTYIVLLLIGVAFVMLLQRRAKPAQVALWGLIFVGAAFFGLGSLANKIGVDIANTDALSAIDALSLYLLGSLAAFDISLERAVALKWGLNIFRSPLAALDALGFPVEVLPLVKTYVYVPEATNVYTVFMPYFEDFGWAGTLVFFALFGWAHTWLYAGAKAFQNPRTVVFAALSAYPLLMQFFQDQYFSLLTTWVTFFVLIYPCFSVAAQSAGQPRLIAAPGASSGPSGKPSRQSNRAC